MLYDVSILIRTAAEKGLQPNDVYKLIQKLPKKDRISRASVHRVFADRRGKPSTLRAVATVLGLELKDIVDVDTPNGSEAA